MVATEPPPNVLADTKRAARNLAHLDGLRALAAGYVVLCHAFLQINFRGHPPGALTRKFFQLFFYGHFAVSVFIVLSGFCLMLPVARGDGTLHGGAWRFFVRRARRIVPPYYCALALSLTLIALCIHQKTGTHWDTCLPVTAHSVLTHLLLVQDATNDAGNINHAFWSISVEWRIYFLFPLLVWAWSRVGAVATTVITLVGAHLLFIGCMRWLGNPLAANYLGLFVMGMFGASVVYADHGAVRTCRRWPWRWITLGLTVVVALVFFPEVWGGPHVRMFVGDYLIGVWATSLLVLTSSNEEGWLTRCLAWRPLAFIGTFAYSVYLIHAPLLQILWQYVFVPLHDEPLPLFAALTLMGTPLILAASYVFFLVCERPFLRRNRKPTEEALIVAAALQPAP